jgi:hypothetical protein
MKYGFGGNACWEIDLGFAGSQNAQNSLTQNYCRQENMERLLNKKIH